MESRLIWAENDTEIKTTFLKDVDLLGGAGKGEQDLKLMQGFG